MSLWHSLHLQMRLTCGERSASWRLRAGLVWLRTWLGTDELFGQDNEGTARASSFLSGTTQTDKEETMVKQRFRVLFRRWFFTVMRFGGPVWVYELFALVRQHFQYAPLGMSALLMGAFLAFMLTALLVLAVGTGKWA